MRFRGTIDFEVAQRYFSTIATSRPKLKYIELSDVWRIHPSGLIPILGDILARGERLKIKCYNNPWVSRYLELQGYSDLLTTGMIQTERSHCRGINRYVTDDERLHRYVNEVLQNMLEREACGPDVLAALEWAIPELIGNVFDHALSPIGVLVHYVRQSHRFILTLTDNGVGLKGSLRQKFPEIEGDAQAIAFAIQKGKTSKSQNYGWGLFGSTQIIREAHGRFILWSGSSIFQISEDGRSHYSDGPYYQGLMIEWILPLTEGLDLAKILERDRRDIFILDFEQRYEASPGIVTLRLAQEASYFGNRAIGKKLRNKLLNLIESCAAKKCIVDFEGVPTINSSFADEFLGKTAVLFGESFARRVLLKNISQINAAICDISIQARVDRERSADTPLRIQRE